MPRKYVIGVATAGDKAIAGPLVATALILDAQIAVPRFAWSGAGGRREWGLADFDAMPAVRRKQVAGWLRARATGVSFLTCTVDQLNNTDFKALRSKAMGRALIRAVEGAVFLDPAFRLTPANTVLMIGGLDPVPLGYAGTASQILFRERQGRPWQLDAAYAVARAYRDGLMQAAHKDHPQYEFGLNYGYASTAHREALEQNGLSTHHRTTSALVREAGGLL